MWQEQGKKMSSEQRFRVRFWGVRGSYPTPGPQAVRHDGNTSCVEMQVGTHTLVFDAGSGIVRLGTQLQQRPKGEPLYASLFITHGHGDHLLGFPFFAPLFDPHAHIHIFGPQLCGQTIEQLVTPLMSPPYFPVDVRQLPSQRAFHTLDDGECIGWKSGSIEPTVYKRQTTKAAKMEVCVAAKFTHSHPRDGSLLYRIEYAGRRVVYATDVEWDTGCTPEFLTFVEGADVLIHDAQYTAHHYQEVSRGYGHSTVEMAVAVARAAHVRDLILFHHEPTYDDDQLDRMEAEARKQFARTHSAYEGLEIDLLAQRTE